MQSLVLLLTIFIALLLLSNGIFCWDGRVEIYAHIDGQLCRSSHQIEFVSSLCRTNGMFGTTSARLIKGGCVKFYRDRECKGSSFTLGYPDTELCSNTGGTPYEAMSQKECHEWTTKITCPNGTFVRSLGFGSSDLRSGLSIHCFRPNNTNAAADLVLTTHVKNGTGDVGHAPISTCPIAGRGLTFQRNTFHEIDTNGRIDCGASNCGGIAALIGIEVLVDERNTIKRSTPVCKDVPNPSDLCDPNESMRFVYLCDNSQSGNEMECSYSSTVGVGVSNTTTVGERQEYTFYREYGYTIGGTLYGLSASMSYKLGESELVAYEWSQSDTSTWKLEETVSVKTILRPYSITRVEQLSGKCSF